MQLKQLTQCCCKVMFSLNLYVMESMLHEVKQHCFLISETKKTTLILIF